MLDDAVTPDSEPQAATSGQAGESGLCPVVGIGASAGGLEAFRQLLSSLPADTGMAFLLVQHLAPQHESQLPELLGKSTHLPVIEARDGMSLEPDHVYVIPPSVNMSIADSAIRLTQRDLADTPHLPVDFLFRSMAHGCKEGAIAVVLSGSGSDGSAGLAEVKAAGGITFAQDEDSADYASMPLSAVATGHVDFVLPPEQIAHELAHIGKHPYMRPAQTPPRDDDSDVEFEKLIGQLRAATGVDFSGYRQTTIKRRIGRRMALHQKHSLEEYVRFASQSSAEVEALYRDVLINVTSFFRDPEMFEALKTTVFPSIVKDKSAQRPIRIWVPGCSTGQEAYSLAMALLEYLDQHPSPPAVQIFGTDINDGAAVEKARPGIYPLTIESELSPQRLRRFFTKVDGGYRIGKAVRDLCIFARQDVTSDPPFSRLDLISCRNLLIYLSPALQQRIIPTFHYALNPGGYLVLGPSETVGKHTDLFEKVDREHNIYARSHTLIKQHPFLGSPTYPLRASVPRSEPSERLPGLSDIRREADRVILGRFAPAAVVIDDNLEILQFRGNTGPYLQAPSGPPTHQILKMARESLFVELRGVIDEARKHNAAAHREGIRFQDEQQVRYLNLEVTPLRLHGAPQRCFLVLFTVTPSLGPTAAQTPADVVTPPADVRENSELRQELASMKEYLQAIIEQQNAANEELQSANEEVRSANEELQSTNEEMQTSKEELQSANEELRTVNDELQARNQELGRVSDDLANILSSIKLPVVMLGPDLRTRRFTPAAGSLLNLIPADIGRSFLDIKSPFDIHGLSPLMFDVIADVTVMQQEVQDSSGRWYTLSIHPYRTGDNRIDGVVLVFRDIDTERRVLDSLAQSSHAKDQFLAVLSHELRTPLTPVLATVAMLEQNDKLDADTREQLAVIHRNAEMEVRLIDDLLDVTRIANGKVELEKRPVDLLDVIGQAVEVCKADIESRRLLFSVDTGDRSYPVNGDPTRLQQVFWNLLRNAIKFTPIGGRVSLRCRADGEDQVIVEVSDTGAGIRPELLRGLFRAFEQGGAQTTRRFGGLGLGLAISKGIVEMHDGTIEARSEGEGKGATLVVKLPLCGDGEALASGKPGDAIEGPAPAKVAPVRILLVEDHLDTARVMARLLSGEGHQVAIAGDIASALQLASSSPIDLLISDVGLPDGSGEDLMRELRKRGHSMPGIALSGYGRDEDMQRTRDAGFAVHLVKPTSPAKLTAAIRQVTASATG